VPYHGVRDSIHRHQIQSRTPCRHSEVVTFVPVVRAAPDEARDGIRVFHAVSHLLGNDAEAGQAMDVGLHVAGARPTVRLRQLHDRIGRRPAEG